MAARRIAARKPMREVYAANNAADKFYAAMAGKEPQNQVEVKAKRVIVNRSPDEDLEKAVLSEVTTVVAGHRNVIWALRANSGSIRDERGVPVWFYRWIRNDSSMTLTDIWGFAEFGLFAIECKRRDWKYTGTPRERQQKAFIDTILRTGGRAGFVTCAEDAHALLR